MKIFFWSLIFLFCSITMIFIGMGVDQVEWMSERYKRALDSGANAAAACHAYVSEDMLEQQGAGYGTGLEDSRNVAVDRDKALEWFYRLFFCNSSLLEAADQERIKMYIPMKALICYDRLMIADMNDDWTAYNAAGEKGYDMQYCGMPYRFTLSDQIYDMTAGEWISGSQLGLTTEERQLLLGEYIISELSCFMNNRYNKESGNRYRLNISLGDVPDDRISPIGGVNFIVFCEGIPLPSMNPFKSQRFFAYGLGGGEIRRK